MRKLQSKQNMLLRHYLRNFVPSSHTSLIRQLPFTTFHASQKQLPPRPKLPEAEIEEEFLKGSGPGGQKINKTNSACQLRHIPTGIVVKCQDSRSREQNRKMARQLLAQRVDELENGVMARSQVVGRDKARRKANVARKSRRKYRALEEAKLASKHPEASSCESAEIESDETAQDLNSSLGEQKDSESLRTRIGMLRERTSKTSEAGNG